jgi:YVTN family beta-propeller protein
LREISVRSDITEVTFDPDYIFVGNKYNDSISVVSTSEYILQPLVNLIHRHGTVQVQGIASNPITKKLYVANRNVPGTLSVIDYYTGSDNSLNYKIIDIPVGNLPNSVSVNPKTNTVYVANINSSSISVIDGTTNKVVTNIAMDSPPFIVTVNPNTNKLYVANLEDGTVDVIDGTTNKVVKKLVTGGSPDHIAVNPKTNMVYITNSYLNTVSVLNGSTNDFAVTINFKTNSPDAGYISCKGKQISDNAYMIYDIDVPITCAAVQNKGFQFKSWSGNLAYATKTNSITFNPTHDGIVTANFEKVPPPPANVVLPKEYYDTLYSVIVGVILAPIASWLVPFIFDHREKKRQRRYLKTYLPLIDDIYKEHHQNVGECLQLLEQERKDISALLQEGIINDSSFGILYGRISEYIDEMKNNNNK